MRAAARAARVFVHNREKNCHTEGIRSFRRGQALFSPGETENRKKERISVAINYRKAAVIGCGFVGASIAFRFLQQGLFSQIGRAHV